MKFFYLISGEDFTNYAKTIKDVISVLKGQGVIVKRKDFKSKAYNVFGENLDEDSFGYTVTREWFWREGE